MMRKRLGIFCKAIAIGAASVTLGADQPATTRPAAPGGARPLLKQLNEETQSLYNEVQAGVCRVQLPPPKWAGAPLAEQENPVHKWGAQLDATVRQRLETEQREAKRGQYRKIIASVDQAPATQPATAPATQQGQSATQNAVGAWTLSTNGDDVLVLRPNGPGAGALQFDAGGSVAADGQIVGNGGRLNVNVTSAGSFTPNNIGLVLDTAGHVLVPICVEREAFDGEAVRLMVGAGPMATARFVGSDRQTNITLLKLDKPLGTPVKLAEGRPQEGNLTMFLSPNTGVGRLMIWSNEVKDWGVVVSMEGGVYGFTRQGQFLSAAGCRSAIDQLAKAGAVRRAKIGLGIAEVPQNDAAREASPTLGTRPAVRVTELAPESPAAGAGLKVGDLILRLNDQPVGDPHAFAAAMSDADARQAAVKFLRDGREQSATIDLPAKDR